MNRNSNVETAIATRDGRLLTLTHRNSFGGYLNALERAGIDPADVLHGAERDAAFATAEVTA